MEEETIHFGKVRGISAPCFYLDHSCDEWIIGELKHAKAFYEELGKKIKEVEAKLNQPK